MQAVIRLAAVAAWLCAQGTLAQVRELPTPAAAGSLVPNLFAAADGRVFLSWIERRADGRSSLRYAVRAGDGWSAPQSSPRVRTGSSTGPTFPRWSNLPDGLLAAHWLVRNRVGPVRLRRADRAFRPMAAEHWSESFSPHRDDTATEHGFVSLFATDDGRLAAAWLDGRNTQPASGADSARQRRDDAALRGDRSRSPPARRSPARRTRVRLLSDVRGGDDRGPARGLSRPFAAEERDIAVVRRRDGRWEEPRALPADLWRIEGCPVNGPAVAAHGRRVAVAWFTAADDVPRVRLAFSANAGASFAASGHRRRRQPAGSRRHGAARRRQRRRQLGRVIAGRQLTARAQGPRGRQQGRLRRRRARRQSDFAWISAAGAQRRHARARLDGRAGPDRATCPFPDPEPG